MSRPADPPCPVPGRPCLKARDDLMVEMARVRAREEARLAVPCRTCRERSRIALAGSSRCYACRVRAIERDHVKGSGSGPAVLLGNANLNRIAAEGERLCRSIG